MNSISRFLLLVVLGSSVLTGCYDPMAPHETDLFQAEKFTDTFEFAMPSVDASTREHDEALFIDGKKTTGMPADAMVSGATAYNYDGAVSLMRTWRVAHNEFNGEYQIRSGPYWIAFFGKYKNARPTIPMLRQIFGKWILLKGDDMSRVHEVPGEYFHKVLVFNDGRPPAETYAPDIKAR